MKIFKNQSLLHYNTFGIDVKAKYFAEFNNTEQLKELLLQFGKMEIPRLVLGGGSNILFTQDFPGVILKNNISGISIISETDSSLKLKVGAGVVWDSVVKFAVENKFWGIENLSLIPGTAGAAPIQNIGAYGCELKDVFSSAEIFNITNFSFEYIFNKDCEFGYRDSIFKNKLKNKFIITNIILSLNKIRQPNLSYHLLKNKFVNIPIDKIKIEDIRKFIIETRKKKLPDTSEFGNAGSFFKNPILNRNEFLIFHEKFPNINHYKTDDDNVKISAAQLIENVGMKGKTYGRTGTHKSHSLILINNGNAKGKEIYDFSKMIKDKVLNKFNIELFEEVNIV